MDKTKLFFLFFFLPVAALLTGLPNAGAQKTTEDSLQQVIRNSKEDTVRVDALLALANQLLKKNNPDVPVLEKLEQARNISLKSTYHTGMLHSLLAIGNYHRGKSEWSKSMEAYNELIRYSQTVARDSLRERSRMMAYNNLGNIFNSNGDFNNALSYRLKAQEIAEILMPENHNGLAIIYLNIASDYRQLKMPAKGLDYLKKTAAFFTKLNGRMKMEYFYESYQSYISYDSIPQATGLLDSIQNGLDNFELTERQKNDFSLMLSKMKGNHALDVENNPAIAMKAYLSALQMAKSNGNYREHTEALNYIGFTNLKLRQYPEAIRYLKEAYDSAKSQSLKNMRFKIAYNLADAYMATGEYAKATPYLKESRDLQMEIYNDEKTEELNFLEAKYNHEKAEKEITTLRLSNTEKELAVTKKNRLIMIGGILTAALLLILGLLYRSGRQKSLLAEKDRKLQQDQILFLERQQQVVSLQSMVNGQETERTRIAKDLHDGLSGMFSTVKMYFSTLQHEKEELKQHPTFTKSIELIDNAADEIRRIAHNMMPEVLMKLGLTHAIQDMCSNISAGKLLQVRLQTYGLEKRMNASTEIMLYRIVQELLNNIMKHAQASSALIQFNRDGNRLMVTVEDNGRGFRLEESDGHPHAGLDTIKSRVNYLNGNITIDSQKDIGTTVIMEFLIDEESV